VSNKGVAENCEYVLILRYISETTPERVIVTVERQ